MPSLPALVTSAAVRQIERRASSTRPRPSTTPRRVVVVVDDRPQRPPVRWRAEEIPVHVDRCAACAQDRQHGPDGRWPVAVAYVELPAWHWEGFVCASCLTDARRASREAGERCHVRLVDDRPPPRLGEIYRTVPRPRERRVIKDQPSNPTIEISGDYGR